MRRTRIRSTIRLGALAVAASMVIVACSSGSDGEEISRLESALADATAENAVLAEELTATQQELSEAKASIRDSRDDAAPMAAALKASQEEVDALNLEVSDLESDLSASDRAVRDAEQALKKSQDSVQALMLAYDDDLAAASDEVSTVAQEFACGYGKEALEAGKSAASLSSTAVLRAFVASDEYSSMLAESESVASLLNFVSDPEDALNAPADEILEAPAAACWQTADAKVNAALYEHKSVLREAVLDAACANNPDDLYDGWNDFTNTAAYQNWRLSVGSDYVYEYEDSIEDRYGSIEAFLAIPDAEIEAETARCADIQPLISPKSTGTWNVGDEIKAGTWKAFDVSDCYWARLAENGNIRANHFGDGLRLSANVSASDGQFEISGCDFYYANP